MKASRELVLTAALVLVPSALQWLISSCDSGPLELEITGQTLQVVEEGYYQNVLIAIQYETVATSARVSGSPSSAFATSPAPPVYINQIEGIEIISDVAFGPNYPAGANLISLFHLAHYRDTHSQHAPSLTFPTDAGESRAVYLHLLEAPVTNIQPVFTVTSTLSNQLVLESELGPVTILK